MLVHLFHRYGVYLGLVQDNSGTMNDLHVVLSTIKMQLKAQQYSNKPTLGNICCKLLYNGLFYKVLIFAMRLLLILCDIRILL